MHTAHQMQHHRPPHPPLHPYWWDFQVEVSFKKKLSNLAIQCKPLTTLELPGTKTNAMSILDRSGDSQGSL